MDSDKIPSYDGIGSSFEAAYSCFMELLAEADLRPKNMQIFSPKDGTTKEVSMDIKEIKLTEEPSKYDSNLFIWSNPRNKLKIIFEVSDRLSCYVDDKANAIPAVHL